MLRRIFRPAPLYVRASIVTSCVAMLFGLDTGSIGPVTTMPAFTKTFGSLSPTLHGFVVSSILLPGAAAAVISGILADLYGRTRLIALGAVIYGLGAALECGATHLAVFILGRLIKGVGDGLFISTVYVQVSEISPARIRGTLMSLPQFAIVIGLVSGYFVCYGTSRIGDSSASWRLPLGLSALLAFGFAATLALVPPSPRWLLAKGQIDQARAVAQQLGLDAAEQEELISQPDAALDQAVNQSFTQSLKQMLAEFRGAFSTPYRARTIFGCFIMASQQFSGIDGVLYYAPVLMAQAGLSSEEASFLASGVSALVIFVTTIPATLLADRWGRRTSSLVGGTMITVLMLIMGSLYAAGDVHATYGAGRWVVIVSIYMFAIVFSATWAIGFRTYLVESLPRKTRSSASSLAQSSCWLANYIVALITPILISSSTFSAYYFFAFCTFVCTVVCALLMFETKGHSLETIEQRYSERRAKATGLWQFESFRPRRVQPSGN